MNFKALLKILKPPTNLEIAVTIKRLAGVLEILLSLGVVFRGDF
jgi:hypothetical protein